VAGAAGNPDTRWQPQSTPQPSLDDALGELSAGRRLRDEGAQAAVNSAHTYWRLAAERTLHDLARAGEVFTAETLRARCGQLGGHPGAIGGLILAAARRGEIEATGYVQTTRPEAHGRPIRLWRGVL
jgi:hypothetical protein